MSYFLAFISKILLFKGNYCLFNQFLYEIHIYQICLRMPFFILKGQFIAFTDALLSIIHSFFFLKSNNQRITKIKSHFPKEFLTSCSSSPKWNTKNPEYGALDEGRNRVLALLFIFLYLASMIGWQKPDWNQKDFLYKRRWWKSWYVLMPFRLIQYPCYADRRYSPTSVEPHKRKEG